MMMAESFRTAILFPLAAMRPSLVAELFIEVVIEEKVSDCDEGQHLLLYATAADAGLMGGNRGGRRGRTELSMTS